MRTTGNNMRCYSSKSSFLKEINLISSHKKKKVSTNRRCSFKPQSCMKKIGTKKNPMVTLQKTSLKRTGKNPSPSCHKENTMHKCDDGVDRRIERRKKQKRKKNNIVRDEPSCLQRRARYLLIKMKLELNLIDAYSGEGWKGQSKEKIKPEKELQRAEKQILRCKLGIRDTIHHLDLLSSEGRIEDSVMHPDGSVSHEHIFCAKCKLREAFPDNDIVLCDGTCNCGFHQKCLEPPLEKIPPGDQGWLCKICECKVEILEAINAHIGTSFTVNSSWEEIFKEATTAPDTENTPHNLEEWPSEDSEDEDYCPEKAENSSSKTGIEEIVADGANSSSGLFCSSSEVSTESDEASDCDITSYRRQRRDVDYKKLYEEMFGKELEDDEQQSEDEDWGPHHRKRRRKGDVSTMADSENVVLHENTSNDRRTLFRIPHKAVEKLRQVFSENELPSRAVKENLSNQLGISAEKVGKWFKNARYAALKIRKAGTTNQLRTNNSIRRSRTTARENRSDGLEVMDSSYLLPLSSIVRIPENLRRMLKKKKSRSTTTHLKNEAPPDKSKVSARFKDDAGVKRRRGSGQGRKLPSEKVDEITKNEQIYLREVERIYCLQDQLQELKKILLTCDNNGHDAADNTSREPCVIYVPVAEVMEKS